MRARMPDLVKWLSAAADRRRAMDPATLDRLDATLAVLQQDHQSTDDSAIANDTLTPVGEVFGLDALDLDLLLVAAAPDVDANLALAYGLLRGTTSPERPNVALALELAGISTMSALAVAKLGESGGLRRAGLIQSAADGSWLARELWCPDRVVAHLQGWDVPDTELAAALLDPTPLQLAGNALLGRALDAGVGLVWIHAPLGTAGLCLATGALDAIGVLALTLPGSGSGHQRWCLPAHRYSRNRPARPGPGAGRRRAAGAAGRPFLGGAVEPGRPGDRGEPAALGLR